MDDLIEQAKRGDSRAFAMLFERHKLALWKTALAVTENDSDASDALQETALRAWRAMPTFEGRSGFGTWLTRIVLRACFDLLRMRKREVPYSAYRDAAPDAGASLDVRERGSERIDESNVLVGRSPQPDRDEAMDVRRAMRALSPNDRTVLALFYLNDYPIRQIASVLSISEGAVRTRLARARERFRRLYENEPKTEIEVS